VSDEQKVGGGGGWGKHSPWPIGAEAPPLSDKPQERVGSSLTCDEQRALPNIHALEMAEGFLRFDWACDPELVNASHKTTTKHERVPDPTEDRAMYQVEERTEEVRRYPPCLIAC
jgi:hypothetical protein